MNLDISLARDLNVPMIINHSANPHALLDLIEEHKMEFLQRLNGAGALIFKGFSCQDEHYFSKIIDL